MRWQSGRCGPFFLFFLACNGGGSDDSASASASEGATTQLTGGPGTTSSTPTGGADDTSTTAASQSGTATTDTPTVATADATADATTTAALTSSTSGTTTVTSLETGGSSGATTDASTADGGTTLAPDLPPPVLACSLDLHAVVDEMQNVVEQCAPDEGCQDAACVPACQAAAASGANFGCEFIVPTPPSYPPALPPCFAVFLANTWGHPAKIAATRDGTALDLGTAARIATPGQPPAMWPVVPPDGIPADAVAVVFLSSHPNAVMPENQVPLTCPFTPTVNAPTAFGGSGRGAAFQLTADIPLTAYDILPFGGARSHFPSAELLFPTSVWGDNYVAMVSMVGTATPAGPMWLQAVGREDGTTLQIVPTTNLAAGPGVNAVAAGQLGEFSLDAGEIIQWQLAAPSEASGTVVLSDKPVAFHTGNRFLRLQPQPAPGGEATHQQNSSVTALGHEYVGSPYETRKKDLTPESVEYRLVGAVEGTILEYDPPIPGAPTMLESGQVADFSTTLAFRVRSQDKDHPFAMAQIMDTANLPGGTRPGATAPGFGLLLGDEEFVHVLPPAQFLARYAFFSDPTYATTNLVFTRTNTGDGFKDVTVDCLGTIGGWQPVGVDGKYEVATADLVRADVGVNGCTNGHHIAESEGAFGLVVWGLDSYSSYAYPAGGSALVLTDIIIEPA